jgi:hypothetical protein
LVESLNLNSGHAGIERQDKSLFAILLEIESQLCKAARDEAGTQIETRKIPTVQNRYQSLRSGLRHYIEQASADSKSCESEKRQSVGHSFIMDPNKHSRSIHRSSSEGNSIQFQLDSAEARWLARQDQFFNGALVGVLTSALCEWMTRNPGRLVDSSNVSHILHRALDEFISRHKDEFL